MPTLITDSNGIPSPQYLKRDGTSYEANKGANGGLDTNVISLPALPAGANNIGKVEVTSLPSLPSGSSIIGTVGVNQLPALPAGTNNIGDVDIASLPELPSGDNIIGKVKAEPLSNITKYLATCTASADTALWTPAAGKAIILKGLRIQNLTEAVGAVATGLGSPNAIVDVKRDSTVIAKVKLQGKHFLSDTTEKIFSAFGDFGAETLSFGDGLVLSADEVISIYSDKEDVTVFAWGFEV